MMLQKYFLAVMMLLSLSLISCRQGDDEFNIEENQTANIFDKKINDRNEAENFEYSKRDSLSNSWVTDPTDPPKDGTHWRQKK